MLNERPSPAVDPVHALARINTQTIAVQQKQMREMERELSILRMLCRDLVREFDDVYDVDIDNLGRATSNVPGDLATLIGRIKDEVGTTE